MSDIVTPSLQQLVEYFRAAKDALANTGPAERANSIVIEARTAVEEAAVLNGRNAFLRRVIVRQQRSLQGVAASLTQISEGVEEEFQVGAALI